MWKKPGTPIPIHHSQLVVGLYIWLDISWIDHPFMTNRIMVETEKQISIIRAHNPDGHLFYYPEMSTAAPLPQQNNSQAQSTDAGAVAAANAEADALVDEVRQEKEAKRAKLRIQQEILARAERDWDNAARSVRDSLLGLARSPKSAGAQLRELSTKTASEIFNGNEVLLHLLGDKKGQGPQFHALNVMTLSMLLGKQAGLSERELCDLAIAALAHDVGKAQIPTALLQSATRKKFEEDFYRQHVQYSMDLATKSGAFSPEAIAIIAAHHEHLDGTGWPLGKKEASKGARVLALVNRYDRLCLPEALGRDAMMPTEALAHIFRKLTGKYDAAMLSLLVRLLGVYPPGTIVQLNDGSLAIVVSPGKTSLQPKVLIYSPEIPKDEAPILELANAPALSITEAIRPVTLPPDVLQWLNPQERLSYFYTVSNGNN